ncbi:DUF84 family protein [Alicyclobacillus acidiphilus]|uniref:DUF84 family protein n=1 Tax=Alicyclobacillus acidiphilus TaxID=182455 RepID=UPI000833C580|nr:DUF84 family protein [Alicyclobacillus acidiphilus]
MNTNRIWRIAVGSSNAAKVKAVEMTFRQLNIPVELGSVNAPSGVSAQPFSDDETLQGAQNRAIHAVLAVHGDLGIGLEGGVVETRLGMFLCNWAAVATPEREVRVGGGVRIHLPEEIAQAVRSGRELGDVVDEWAGRKHVRAGEGTIGILTNGQITRAQMFRDALICALSPFLDRLTGPWITR